MFAVVAVLLALGGASAGRGLLQRRLPPLPIDPRTEALAATITTAGTLAAARPLFSPVDIIMARTCSLLELVMSIARPLFSPVDLIMARTCSLPVLSMSDARSARLRTCFIGCSVD